MYSDGSHVMLGYFHICQSEISIAYVKQEASQLMFLLFVIQCCDRLDCHD
jgi:hypothetical protein